MQQNFHRESVNYFWITIGSLLFCAGLNLFIVPVGLYNGGTVGISQIIRTLLQSRLALPAGFDIAGILNLILNIPLLALAFLQFGRPLFLKTVYSVLTQTAFFSLIAIPSVPILSDRLTACIIGGLLAGLRFVRERRPEELLAEERVLTALAARGLPLFLLEIRLQLIAHPRVVAERDDVRAGSKDRIRLLGRDADDVGVFTVDDREIDVLPLLEGAQVLAQKCKAGRTHNVAHGQNTQDHADPSHAIGRKFDNRNSIPPTAAGNQSRNWRGADFIAFCPRAHTSRAAVQLRREAET